MLLVVVGPLNELSRSVRVRGQLPGATVRVETSGPAPRLVAEGVAVSGDQRFPLLPNARLDRTDLVYARQRLGAAHSDVPSGDQAMPVGPAPDAVGPVAVPTHLYECGRYVYVDGATPGAEVALFADGTRLGSGPADEGVARLGLDDPIPPASWVTVHQSAPGAAQGPDYGVRADPIPHDASRPLPQPLPPPMLDVPPRGCDQSLAVSGIVDGATVTISHRSGLVEEAGCDAAALRLYVQPLQEDDELTLSQAVGPRCERTPTPSRPIQVGKAEPVAAPVILGPLCVGAPVVRVTGLRPGAIVHLAANRQVYDGAPPPDQDWMDCHIPPLTGDPVSATQELCAVTSPPAPLVLVDPHEDHVPAPLLVEPLLSCTGVVGVTRAHRGSFLQAFASTIAGSFPISDQVFATTTNVVIDVRPLLIDGSHVYVKQWACSDTSTDSEERRVDAHPAPGPVDVLGPLAAGDRTVGVRGALNGATVEVYLRRRDGALVEFLGWATSWALRPVTEVTLRRPLAEKERVTAVQRICGRTSEPRTGQVVDAAARFGPRPFYVVGHNPNTIADATADLADGANGLEPDVQVYANDPQRLCISHGTGSSDAPTPDDYLDELHALAAANPQLALVVFDCKPEVTTPDHGFELLTAIRQHLTFDNDLNVIISIATREKRQGEFFDRIVDILGPREGLMIDAEDDPGSVSDYFVGRGVTNHGYGNGITPVNFAIGPYYRYTVEAACGIRAAAGRPRFVYVWTVNVHDELREYIRIGSDGAITDDPSDLVAIASQFPSLVRMARREDNPFRPANFAYSLHVSTSDRSMAGTDANVTFTLTGALGSASKTVDTELVKRMESGSWNWVTLPSPDLGQLQSITVQRDDAGNAPDWHLDRIQVRGVRFGTSAQAVFDRWIDDTSPVTMPLSLWP
jgi:hypothetical protein